MRGSVTHIKGVPEFAAGGRRMRLCEAHAPGPSDLVFRPEDAVPPSSLDCNRLEGSVTTSIFMGRCWRLSVLVDTQPMQVDWPVRVPTGEAFAFAVPPDRCVTLALEPGLAAPHLSERPAAGAAERGRGRKYG